MDRLSYFFGAFLVLLTVPDVDEYDEVVTRNSGFTDGVFMACF
tara:strand:- start:1138 stop:1266 length:129 start_codon:yes stop_codon:yes gene_type:complete